MGCVLSLAAQADSVVVFSELMYHPATNEPGLEWLELHNQMSVNVDVSGWRITGGIDYTFPSNSLIPARGYSVIAISPETLAAAAAISNAFGPYTGRLSNSGETLQLRDRNDRLMDEISYGTDGQWPEGADGAGVSLAKKAPDLSSQAAENWTVSAQLGGTPGAANFPTMTPPPKLALNEVSGASTTAFWLELMNYGDAPMELAGVQIVRAGSGSPACVLPAQTLPPGGFLVLSQTQLGFTAASGQELFLYAAGRALLLDAVSVKASPRGRHPDGMGDWAYSAPATPGASNSFEFHHEIVFNEVMYHYPPLDPVPAVTTNTTLIDIGGRWRFEDSGTDLDTAWRAADYTDSAWASGSGLFYCRTGILPAPTNTPVAPGRTAYYFRTRFNFAGATTNVALNLRCLVDDGAIFYLNGAEIYRQNMPSGPVTYDTFASAPIGDAIYAGPFTVPVSNLLQGVNVLAVEVHQSAPTPASSGIVLQGGGLALVEEGPFGGSPPMNLARQPGVTPFAIDSLAGYTIHNYLHLDDGVYGNANSWIGNSGNPGYAGLSFGGRYTLHSFAFGRDNLGGYADRTLGLYTLQYTRVASPGTSTAFTGDPDTGWATIGTLNYQAAGTGLFTAPSRRHCYTFTPVTATGLRLVVPGTGYSNGTCIDELEVNPPDTTGDIAFGAELVLTTTNAPATPFTKSREEWVELYNRSTNTVDLTGWRIDGGIQYLFPAGTLVHEGGYLVVANDAATLQAKWPEVATSILGDFSGKMKAGERVSLKDARGNVANAIRVFPLGWSDGGGCSLELIDPRADNASPDAWAESDESSRSAWQKVSYTMVAGQRYGSTFWNEFRLGMLDAGEALVDDVSVLRDPSGGRVQLIQNGNFETVVGNTHWRLLGNHGNSQIITDPENPGNHVLKVSATSPARTSHNHIESSFVANTPIVDGQTYEVSYRARWVAGSPQLNTTAYFQKLARTTILAVPSRHGTPGAPNSRRLANAGPTFSDLKHAPVCPNANQPVTISVRAGDPDGVASVWLHYRVNPASAFTSLPMAPQADGTWTTVIPGQASGRVVQFYVRAQDGLAASSVAPAKGPASRALYQVADAQRSALPAHQLRVIQLDADRDFLLNITNVMSQQPLGATVIYDGAEVFYDVGMRLQGSAAGRARDGDDYISYELEFPPDHLFRGVHKSVTIDRSGRTPVTRHQDEIYILHMFQRAGLPCYYSDLCYFIAPKTLHTGTAMLKLGGYDGLFVEEQYGGLDGSIFNWDITYEPSLTVGGSFEGVKLPVPLQEQIGTDLANLGNDKEQYRSPFDIRHGERADDFSGIIRLCQTMDLPQPLFDAQIAAALDVSEAQRLTALTILCGIFDIYFSAVPSLPHNSRPFTPANPGPAQFLPWDMDFVFTGDPNGSIFPTATAHLSKLVSSPGFRRQYLWHVYDLCQTVFNTAYMSPWLAHYGNVVGQDFTSSANYIQTRRTAALRQIPPRQPFVITSNGGNRLLTDSPQVTLTGCGWLDINEIRLMGGTAPLAVTWTTVTNWQVTVPLLLGANQLMLVAYDHRTNFLANAGITVTTTAANGGVDSDLDGMPDAWELANGLAPLISDANLDRDGDGFTNLHEYLAGTDPNDPRSFLRLRVMPEGGELCLSFLAVAGRSYSVLYRDNLASGGWLKLTNALPQAADRTVDMRLPQPSSSAQRYFQLVTPRQP